MATAPALVEDEETAKLVPRARFIPRPHVDRSSMDDELNLALKLCLELRSTNHNQKNGSEALSKVAVT